MTDPQRKALHLTMATPGWAVVVAEAQARIDRAKLMALANTDWAQAEPLWRKAHAAYDALQEFIKELEAETGA